jgi:hypothetical protein
VDLKLQNALLVFVARFAVDVLENELRLDQIQSGKSGEST